MNFLVKRLDSGEVSECETIEEEWVTALEMSKAQQDAGIPVNITTSTIVKKKIIDKKKKK